MQQAKTIQTETLATREHTVSRNKAAMVRNNPQYCINAHIVDMYNWRALEMAIAATEGGK